MRRLALAALLGVGLGAGVAHADQWTDPNGRLTFNKPSGWQAEAAGPQTSQTVVLLFNASNDCYVFGLPNPGTANSSPDAARNTTDPLTPDAWVTAASAVRDFFPSGTTPQLVSQTVDTSGFWPVQRAQLQGGGKTVFGAVQVRPGFEMRAFCASTSGGESPGFAQIFNSLGHPNDATWQAEAQQQVSDREARAAAAAAAAEAAAAEQSNSQAQPEADGVDDGVARTSRDPRARRRRD
ncbi:MAG TPA: hypothetical protein VEA80_16410 [Vitreimonas sp.]|uniref:hypothetical protein n=1 Tax=Vitreimonas sp. TaxID=3069702 RepID=UPI002D5264AA|nr:hypothetical protein [Vitreimonas sp.]HYD89061.1 hypothetical protein [Vitreimonas sp.]